VYFLRNIGETLHRQGENGFAHAVEFCCHMLLLPYVLYMYIVHSTYACTKYTNYFPCAVYGSDCASSSHKGCNDNLSSSDVSPNESSCTLRPLADTPRTMRDT
jgi:hypothetical protein